MLQHGKDRTGRGAGPTPSRYAAGQSPAGDLFCEEDYEEYLRLMSVKQDGVKSFVD